MDSLPFISDKTCQICHINKHDIKLALDYIEAFKFRDVSNNSHYYLSIERINKYNNGDYKDFIDEYNAHWGCLPKVNQIDYNEKIKILNKSTEINKYNFIITNLENKNNDLKEKLKLLQNNNNYLKDENVNLKDENVNLKDNNNYLKDEIVNLRENKSYLKDENIILREKIKEQEDIIKQMIDKLEKNKTIFQKLF